MNPRSIGKGLRRLGSIALRILVLCWVGCCMVSEGAAQAPATYELVAAGGRVVEIRGATVRPRTPLQLWDAMGGAGQRWHFTKAADSFVIQSQLGTVLETPATSPAAPSFVYTAEFRPAFASQQWQLIPAPDGGYYIQALQGGVLEVIGGGTDNGTSVWVAPFSGTSAQRFRLRKVAAGGAGVAEAPLVALDRSRWPAGPDGVTRISVCWENPSPADVTQRSWVTAAIARTWQASAAIDFAWSGACPSGAFDGIRIFIADAWPASMGLGRFISGVRRGLVLNFTFARWGSSCADSSVYQGCIETIAIHEFGHALGFAHEHNRADCAFPCNEDSCDSPCVGSSCATLCLEEPQGTDGDYTLTDCDQESIMNYCFNRGFRNSLSAFDAAGAQALYGTRRSAPGTLERRTFRLRDVPAHCPVGETRGDHEFAGGPSIHSSVTLSISDDQRSIVATTTLLMVETKSDHSSLNGHFEDVLWTAEVGKRIVSINSPTSSQVGYRGVSAGGEFLSCGDGTVESHAPEMSGAARSFQIIGDTGGDDISGDGDCHCDAQLRGVTLNPITVTLASL